MGGPQGSFGGPSGVQRGQGGPGKGWRSIREVPGRSWGGIGNLIFILGCGFVDCLKKYKCFQFGAVFRSGRCSLRYATFHFASKRAFCVTVR